VDLTKTLAEIAITGIFEGMHVQAVSIIDALEHEQVNDLSRISLRGLLLMSQEKYSAAIETLEPWCVSNDDRFDTPHAFLALALWRSGNSDGAKKWCTRLLKDCTDESTRSLANEVLLQIGE